MLFWILVILLRRIAFFDFFWRGVAEEHHEFAQLLPIQGGQLEQFLSEHDNVVVTFYANWCQHSQAFLPDLDTISQHAVEWKAALSFVMVDCVFSQEICEKYNVLQWDLISTFD